MLESRLRKRLRALHIDNFKDYLDYVFSPEGSEVELIYMVDAVTTNKTGFFREPEHFNYLMETGFPEIIKTNRTIKAWSAGCSSGEEAYTLAILLSEFKAANGPLDFNIQATDICNEVLMKGVIAVYPENTITHIPFTLKKKYFLKSKGSLDKTVRIIPELRRKITFRRLNFMDSNYGNINDYDMIMCRNVIIYFNKEVQEQVIRKLLYKLKPGGYFFLGHSESIQGMDLPLTQIKPTIFKKI